MTRRAFTLLEVMVASAAALFVVAAATSSVLMIIRTLNRSGQSSAVITEAQLLSEYLTAQVQSMGGGAVRPWMVLIHENNTGANGSDVMRFADLPASVPTSATIMSRLSGPSFSLFVPIGNSGGGQCNLRELRKDLDNDGLPEGREVTRAQYDASELRDREAILVSPSGETWRSVIVRTVGMAESEQGCFVQFDGSDNALDANGFFARADRFNSFLGFEDMEQWVGGQLAFVRAREWRFVPGEGGAKGRLVETLKDQGPAVERTLFENVADVQFAFGYDFDPFDGELKETLDHVKDEWVNHAPTDDLRFSRIPADLLAMPEDDRIEPELIRMIELGVVVGLPRAERSLTVRALDGQPRSAPEARVVGGRAYLRNLLLFL